MIDKRDLGTRLQLGMVLLLLSAALAPFVMFGLLGLALAPIAAAILISGALRLTYRSAPGESGATASMLLATIALFAVAFFASSLCFRLAISWLRPTLESPTASSWLLLISSAAVAPALMAYAARRVGSISRSLILQAALLPIGVIVVFAILSRVLPLVA